MDSLYKELKNYGTVKANELLSKHTTFGIGGPAAYLVETADSGKLVELLNFLSAEGVDFFVLGGGSNLLFPDRGYDGVVIKIKNNKLVSEGETIAVESGVLLGMAVNLAIKNGWSGLEWAAGIPGTVGGAVHGNAGAMGFNTSNNVAKVEVWRNGEVIQLDTKECQFGYRESIFKHNHDVILRAWFKLVPGDKKEILAKVQGYLKQRGNIPPYPSAGSFFKNIRLENWPHDVKDLPEKFRERGTVPVGWLAEQLGLKGTKIGGAQIALEHGNFIVNMGKASQADVLALLELFKEKVYDKYAVELEPEVEIIS